MRDRPLAVVLANFKSKWNPGWDITQAHRIGSKDRFLLLNSATGDTQLRSISWTKRIYDSPIWSMNLGANTDNAVFFDVGSKSYLMYGNSRTGKVKIFPLDSKAKIGTETFESTWSTGWDNMQTYTIGEKVFLVILKSKTGDIHIHELDADGKVGQGTWDKRLDPGWKVARTYEINNRAFLFLLRPDNGLVEIYELGDVGQIIRLVKQHDWSAGWTVASFEQIGSDTFLFLLKTSTGQVHIQRMRDNGNIGERTFTNDWSSGWDSATFYKVDNTTCISLLKSSNGAGHLHEMNTNGSVGTRINPKEPFTKEFAEELLTLKGSGKELLQDYFLDISRGRVVLRPSFVTEWITIPDSWENIKLLERYYKAKAGLNEALAKGYSIPNDQSVIVIHSQPGDSGASGRFVLSHPHGMTIEFMSHEVLHTWSLGHAYSDEEKELDPWKNDLGWGVYDNPWDIMSAMRAYGFPNDRNKSVGPGMGIFSLDRMGWLDEKYTTHIEVGSPGRDYTINSLSFRLNDTETSLKVHYSLGEYYGVEYRTKQEWDFGIPNATVLIHRVEPFFVTRNPSWKGDFGTKWDIFHVYRIDGTSYLLRYKVVSANVEVNRISENGRLEEEIQFGPLSSGWTSIETYSIGAKDFIFFLNKFSGKAEIFSIKNNGALGTSIKKYKWSLGWTSAKAYIVNETLHLFFLKESTGDVHLHEINTNGTVGTEIARHDWSSGWSHVHFYYKGKSTFLLLYKTGNGQMHTHKIDNNGCVGQRLETKTWLKGWDSIHSYGTVGTMLCRMNSKTGKTYFQIVKSDGLLKEIYIKSKFNWSSGWTNAFGFGTTSGVFLFIYKRDTGRCEILLASVCRILRKRKAVDKKRGPIQEIDENGVKIKVIESGRADNTAIVRVE